MRLQEMRQLVKDFQVMGAPLKALLITWMGTAPIFERSTPWNVTPDTVIGIVARPCPCQQLLRAPDNVRKLGILAAENYGALVWAGERQSNREIRFSATCTSAVVDLIGG